MRVLNATMLYEISAIQIIFPLFLKLKVLGEKSINTQSAA